MLKYVYYFAVILSLIVYWCVLRNIAQTQLDYMKRHKASIESLDTKTTYIYDIFVDTEVLDLTIIDEED